MKLDYISVQCLLMCFHSIIMSGAAWGVEGYINLTEKNEENSVPVVKSAVFIKGSLQD